MSGLSIPFRPSPPQYLKRTRLIVPTHWSWIMEPLLVRQAPSSMCITGLHIQMAYTSLDTSSMQILLLSAHVCMHFA